MPLSFRELTQPCVEPVSLAQAKAHLRIEQAFTEDDTYISALITAARQLVEKQTHRAIFNRSILLTLDYFPWPGWGGTTGSTAHDYFMHWYYRGLTIRLPISAAISVQSITYIANDGVTLLTIPPSNYILDPTSEPGRIMPVPSYTWPYQQNYIPGQVRVTFTAGTYELAVTEEFTGATGTYTLLQAANLVTFTGVTNASGQAITVTNTAGVLKFDPSLSGQTLTANYTVNNCPQTIVFAILLLIGHYYEHRMAVVAGTMTEMPMAVEALLANETIESFDW